MNGPFPVSTDEMMGSLRLVGGAYEVFDGIFGKDKDILKYNSRKSDGFETARQYYKDRNIKPAG